MLADGGNWLPCPLLTDLGTRPQEGLKLDQLGIYTGLSPFSLVEMVEGVGV